MMVVFLKFHILCFRILTVSVILNVVKNLNTSTLTFQRDLLSMDYFVL